MRNPPVVQLILTASFAPTLDTLNMLDIADLFGEFREHYPVFQHLPRAGPMSFVPFQASLELNHNMPRVGFGNADISEQFMFQNDRLTFAWTRTTGLSENANYPGFDAIASKLYGGLEILRKWLMKRGHAEPVPIVGEVFYDDAFSILLPSGVSRGVEDVFTFMDPSHRSDRLAFQHSWTESLQGEVPGFAHVSVSAPALLADGSSAIRMITSVSFDAAQNWAAMRERFSVAHGAALGIFDRVVKPEIRAN